MCMYIYLMYEVYVAASRLVGPDRGTETRPDWTDL